ncbi:MAG: hypothetical protein RLZZ535_2435 [Cyanobacteriota bacterium]|jgi:hypothetical protein
MDAKDFLQILSVAQKLRPGLDEILKEARAKDVIVIWKLDRLGRSLKHLVELVAELNQRDIGLRSLNDPIDTTTAQGRLVFNIFASLAEIKDGVVATLTTKTGQYRIVEEDDFQHLYGLARDVDRLRGGLRMVTVAVRAAQKHPDPENLEVLAEAVAMLGELPELPTRDSFEPLIPEAPNLDEDDDVMLDPHQIERPLNNDPLALEGELH